MLHRSAWLRARSIHAARLFFALLAGTVFGLGARPASAESAAIRDKGREVAVASFDRFAEGWMEKMRGLEAENRRKPARATDGVSYRGYGTEYKTELKPTGYARAPYVGVLRYTENEYRCDDVGASACSVASTMPVTEIFRFQDGRWIY